MDEPPFINPPQVTDRRDRLWTKHSPRLWRHIAVRPNGKTQPLDLSWPALEYLLGPLTLVTVPIPVPEPTPDGAPSP